MIESYSFGEIIISGKTYKSDVIIYPDHVDAHWWRKQGHNLEIDDIKEVIDAKPDIVVIGTGQPGLMHVDDKTREKINNFGIKTIVLPTEKACQEYNHIVNRQKVIACLHLTC
jgi:hypothetical protein